MRALLAGAFLFLFVAPLFICFETVFAADLLGDGVQRKERSYVLLPVKAVTDVRAAKVFTTSYKKEAATVGNWRGRVKGLGRTSVFLHFLRNGEIIDKRLIGRVLLENEPNGVFFSYRGPLPKIPSLKWDIVAISEQIS